jgi:chemotaxis protein MotC
MKRGVRAAIVGVCCLCGGSALANTMLEIRSGLKRLHQVQDEIARGVSDAPQLQNAILERLMVSFEALPAASSVDQDYQSLLAQLALSGGDRKRIAKIFRQSHENWTIDPLLSGVEAYMEGHMEKAASAFEQIEAAGGDVSDFGHFLVLAKGTALLETDLSKAREAFERATLYAPGTLVEEVALRRLVRIGLKQKDPVLFVRCAVLYIRRYAKSPFASEFFSSFVEGVRLVTNAEDTSRLGDLVTLLPEETGHNLLVQAAGVFLAEGKIEMAKVFISRLPDNGTVKHKASSKLTESQLLGMLVNMSGSRATETLTLLQDIDQEQFKLESSGLLEIARHVAWNIHKPLAASSSQTNSEGKTPSGASTEFADVDLVLARAKAMLDPSEKTKERTR